MLQACHSSFQVDCGMILCLLTLSRIPVPIPIAPAIKKEVKKEEIEEDSKIHSENAKLYCYSNQYV